MNILAILSLLVQIAQLILGHLTTAATTASSNGTTAETALVNTAQALHAHLAAFVPPKKS